MKTIASTIAISAALAAAACTSPGPGTNTVVNVNASAPSTAANTSGERPQTMTAHTTEGMPRGANSGGTPDPSSPGKFAQGGEAIDTAKFDGTIAAGEKAVKAKPTDEKAKKDLAAAYYDRAVALTDARQYAAALGDYRHALKIDPTHAEAKDWIAQIEGIYQMLKKDVPKEGQEPPPLPFKKG